MLIWGHRLSSSNQGCMKFRKLCNETLSTQAPRAVSFFKVNNTCRWVPGTYQNYVKYAVPRAADNKSDVAQTVRSQASHWRLLSRNNSPIIDDFTFQLPGAEVFVNAPHNVIKLLHFWQGVVSHHLCL